MINSIFCFIPAKINSSRLKQKNIKLLHGKPMINYCIDEAKKSNLFDNHIYISTDSSKIKKIAENQGARVPQLRPKKLGKDPYGVSDTLVDFINRNPHLNNFSHVAIILPTSPLIDREDILKAYNLCETRGFKTVMSVCETDHNAIRAVKIENDLIVPLFDKEIKKQSQLLKPTYRINGAVMILEIKTFLKHKSYFTPEIGAFIMPKERSIDVDTLDDFNYANFLLNTKKKEFKTSYKCLNQNHFVSQNFSLIPIRFQDRIPIMKWRNEQLYHLRQKSPLTIEDQNDYFEKTVSKLFYLSNPNQVLFSFLENQKLVGYGGLVHIDWRDRRAEISFVMKTSLEKDFFSQYWGEFLKMIEEVAFKELSFFKLFVYAFDLRQHLYPVLEENHYAEEARLKNHIFNENKYHDVLIYSKFNKTDENSITT